MKKNIQGMVKKGREDVVEYREKSRLPD